jgi:hypothetical protein
VEKGGKKGWAGAESNRDLGPMKIFHSMHRRSGAEILRGGNGRFTPSVTGNRFEPAPEETGYR